MVMRKTSVLLMALLIVMVEGVALAQTPTGSAKLGGRVRNPVFNPFNPVQVVYERQNDDVQELLLYTTNVGSIQTITAAQGTPDPSESGGLIEQLFESNEDLSGLRLFEGQLSWRPVLDSSGRHWFAFVSSLSGDFDVYLNYLDRTGRLSTEAPIRLPHPGVDQHPSWSPDGDNLAFVSGDNAGGDLFLATGMNFIIRSGGLRSFTPKRLTFNPNDDNYPAWSPDGQFLAYQSLETEGEVTNWGINLLYASEAKGGSIPTPIRLTRTSEYQALHEYQPSWSPDSRYISFYLSQSRVDQNDGDALLDIGILALVFTDARQNRVDPSHVIHLTGSTPRIAQNVIPERNRGPIWLPTQTVPAGESMIVYVSRDADLFNPIKIARVNQWQDMKAGFDANLSAQYGTRLHRDIAVTAVGRATDPAFAFVSQVGSENRIQVRLPKTVSRTTAPPTTTGARSGGGTGAVGYLIPGLNQTRAGEKGKGSALTTAGLGSAAAFGLLSLLHVRSVNASNESQASYEEELAELARDGRIEAGTLAEFRSADGTVRSPAYERWESNHKSARRMGTLRLLAAGLTAIVYTVNLIDNASLRSGGIQVGDTLVRLPSVDLGYEGQSVRVEIGTAIRF